jgi:hypothetical protein
MLDRLRFCDEATFHVFETVSRYKCAGTYGEVKITEHGRDSPKVNAWGALTKSKVVGPFFLEEPT